MEEQQVKEKSVNILGHRYDGIENTELLILLKSKGIEINLVLPSSCSIESIITAPQANLNIVTDFAALPLAKKMQERFGMNYVYFDKYLSIDRVEAGYLELADKLGIDLSDEVAALKAEAAAQMDEMRQLLTGKSFIYGNTPMLAFELSSFLCQLGMEPKLIQARDLYINDDIYMKEIVDAGYDPYVSRIANVAPLQQLYDEIKPNFYIGHENPRTLMEKGIIQVTMDMVAKKLGFEVPLLAMKILAKSETNPAITHGKERGHAAS
jgi:nitrogenase molybdenum-cofactor synthesis protein NifE